jgi:F-type H+-transporting ATPase subunit delta
MAKLVAHVYSDALFEVAIEENKIDQLFQELQEITDLFKSYPEFFELFKTPKISVEDKKKSIEVVFKGKISDEMMNFLKIILDKRRSSAIFTIKNEFDKKVYAHKGIEKATVESAIALEEAQLKGLEVKLSEMTGKQIELKNVINKDVLGGLLLRVGDKVVDGTLRKRLVDMQDNLAQIIV